MAPNSARETLQELVRRKNLWPAGSPGPRTGSLDPATAQSAAVLILFGPVDGQTAMGQTPDGAAASALDVLIVVRANTLRQHAGQPAFPGGKVDPEDYEAAAAEGLPVSHVTALREAVEETGLDPNGVEILGELQPLPLAVSNFMVTPVLAWWRDTSQVAAQDIGESSLVLRVPVAELLDSANRYTVRSRRGRATHLSPAFRVNGGGENLVIWGFTGILLDKIFEEAGWAQPFTRTERREIEI